MPNKEVRWVQIRSNIMVTGESECTGKNNKKIIPPHRNDSSISVVSMDDNSWFCNHGGCKTRPFLILSTLPFRSLQNCWYDLVEEKSHFAGLAVSLNSSSCTRVVPPRVTLEGKNRKECTPEKAYNASPFHWNKLGLFSYCFQKEKSHELVFFFSSETTFIFLFFSFFFAHTFVQIRESTKGAWKGRGKDQPALLL